MFLAVYLDNFGSTSELYHLEQCYARVGCLQRPLHLSLFFTGHRWRLQTRRGVVAGGCEAYGCSSGQNCFNFEVVSITLGEFSSRVFPGFARGARVSTLDGRKGLQSE